MARAARPLAVGVATHLGWVAVAVLEMRRPYGAAPVVLHTAHLPLTGPDDREAQEPYHVAGGFDGLDRVPPPPDPRKVIDRGIARQRRGARVAFRALLEPFAAPVKWGAVLAARGRVQTELEKILASHAQIHIAEGNAVRDSAARALGDLGAAVSWIDRKSASQELLGALGAESVPTLPEPANGGPWRKEEREAAHAAWLAVIG